MQEKMQLKIRTYKTIVIGIFAQVGVSFNIEQRWKSEATLVQVRKVLKKYWTLKRWVKVQ